jgi:hypothetical protein
MIQPSESPNSNLTDCTEAPDRLMPVTGFISCR